MCMREEAGYKTAAGSLKMFLVERQEGHSGPTVARSRESAATLSISRVIDTNTQTPWPLLTAHSG